MLAWRVLGLDLEGIKYVFAGQCRGKAYSTVLHIAPHSAYNHVTYTTLPRI
jgi:hypothetical protein